MKNQPAFPGLHPSKDCQFNDPGMTVRQYAAVHILMGILAANDHADPVAAAVAYTDEILEALEQ